MYWEWVCFFFVGKILMVNSLINCYHSIWLSFVGKILMIVSFLFLVCSVIWFVLCPSVKSSFAKCFPLLFWFVRLWSPSDMVSKWVNVLIEAASAMKLNYYACKTIDYEVKHVTPLPLTGFQLTNAHLPVFQLASCNPAVKWASLSIWP